MIEDMSTERLAVRRMFGTEAVLVGSVGTVRAPGRLEIIVDGRRLAAASTFQELLVRAIGRASRRLGRPPVAVGIR